MTGFEEIKKKFDGLTAPDAVSIAAILAVAAFAVIGYVISAGPEKAVVSRESNLKEFNRLSHEYQKRQASLELLEKRLLTPQSGATTGALIEEIGRRIGLAAASFKPLEDMTEKGNLKKGVEVKFDGITLNQTANLLYKIETHGNLLLIKDFSLRSRFNNQDLFDVTMTIFLVVRQHG